MKSHIKAVHRDGGFNMKTWIKCENVENVEHESAFVNL